MHTILIKITFIPGLKDIVLAELASHRDLAVSHSTDEALYLCFVPNFKVLRELRSILNIYLVKQDDSLNPYFISHHKSILGDLVETVMQGNTDTFHTFKLSCAGDDSKEVRDIQKFIQHTYKVTPSEDADLEMYIGKSKELWEVGVRLTARPLSLRSYKVANIKGGLNPTVAYAMNALANVGNATSYLNIFSGSATLLIEAAQLYPKLSYLGFDKDGITNARAVENIKRAGLLKSIALKRADIFDAPELGMFDVITSDLPFGMQIAKGEDLEKLYSSFVAYSSRALHPEGTLVVYTAKHELLEKVLEASNFDIVNALELKVPTSANAYLRPKIFVCKLK